jgi:hypothetical protein
MVGTWLDENPERKMIATAAAARMARIDWRGITRRGSTLMPIPSSSTNVPYASSFLTISKIR